MCIGLYWILSGMSSDGIRMVNGLYLEMDWNVLWWTLAHTLVGNLVLMYVYINLHIAKYKHKQAYLWKFSENTKGMFWNTQHMCLYTTNTYYNTYHKKDCICIGIGSDICPCSNTDFTELMMWPWHWPCETRKVQIVQFFFWERKVKFANLEKNHILGGKKLNHIPSP